MPPPQFIGRYEIVGSIGSGGMGTLLRARDPKIGGRTVAIKLLKEGLDNEEIRRRFMQEANAAGVLEHENIVRIFDVGEQEGEPFIAMEYIDGETLSAWIRRREPAPIARKLRLLEELCDGLAYAHTFGIVHRDIKPANLMVEKRRGRLKILDFGIAKLADSGITNAGALIGSFNYMSPEQVRGLPIDHRSDIFSVGAVIFELLCYRQAFPGGLGDGVLGRIAEQPAPRLSDVMADADPEIEQIIARTLDKEPARRYQDLSALHKDLTRVRRRLERDESAEHTMVDRLPEGRAPQPTPTSTPKPTPRPARPAPEADRLARIRAQQIEEHLAAAQRAFEAGELEQAIDLTYRASAVDEQDARSHELRDRVQAALDEREARRLLREARAALSRGELDEAEALVARSREAKPDQTELGEIGQEIARARNQQAAAQALQRARSSLGGQEWTAAIRASAEAEAYAPGLEEARQIRRRAQAALDEQRRLEAHDQAGRHVIVEARQLVAQGDLAGAINRLAAFAPPHPLVSRELDRLRAELAALEERAARERERLDRIRHEVEAARRAIVHGALDEARAHATAAAKDGADPRLLENLRAEIDLARQHAEAQARRQAQVDALVAEAHAKAAAGEHRGALVRCEAALRIQPDEPRALDLRHRAHRAIEAEEERRRRETEEARRRQEAEEAERRRLADEARLRHEAEEARRAREAHDAAAREAITLARREFDAGHHREALSRLAGFAPLHDEVTGAIAALRAELTTLEAAANVAVADARALFAAGRYDEAFARLDTFQPVTLPIVSRAREALELESARLAEAAERARREQEERQRTEAQRRARLERIAALTASARELAADGRLDEALAALGEAGRLDPANADLAELSRSVRAARAARDASERRAQEMAATLADAEARLAAGDLAGARARVDEVWRLDRQYEPAQAVEERLRAAEAADRAARAAQRQAAEADRQAQERGAQIAALLKKAKKAKKPAEAIAAIEDALRIDPAHLEARSLLDARRAEIAHAEQARTAEAQARADAQARAAEEKARAAEEKVRAAEAKAARAAEEKAARAKAAAPAPRQGAAEGGAGLPARPPARPVPVGVVAAAAVVLLLLAASAIYYFTRTGPEQQGRNGTSTSNPPQPGPDPDNGANAGPDPTPKPIDPVPVVPTAGLAPVSIDAAPWARVTITPAAGGAAVSCTTPCAMQLAAGEYLLAFENGGLSRPLTDRMLVTEGRALDLRKTMPGFDPDRAVTSILGASQP